MCAICGVLDWKRRRGIERENILRMQAALRHRGPDGSDMLMLKGVALGFNRLSFLDLEGGMQPLQNEDGSISMVCNGEIFNFPDLSVESDNG